MAGLVKPSLGGAWTVAARLVARWLDARERLDALMDSLPADLGPTDRSRCQNLVYGVVRHYGRIAALLDRRIAHPPRLPTRAVLFVAGFELIEVAGEEGRAARIVHHAVERAKELASPAEAALVNAVVRRMAEEVREQRPPPPIAPAAQLAEYFSHPEWLVRRWLADFGAAGTRALLAWNQEPAPVHVRWRDPGLPPPDWLVATPWDGFFGVPPGSHAALVPLHEAGSAYIQDPGTRIAADLLAPRPGETVLDLCAAPGGKSLLLADRMASGRLVALDLPTARIDRLKQNLARARGVDVALVQADLLQGGAAALGAHGLPLRYDAILLDAPCSNTGVMRHRADVKWRLQEGDFGKHARQQGAMLGRALALLAPGGRLVYSTCSIDAAENERVAAAFAARHEGVAVEKSVVALPWLAHHDGAAAFRFGRG